MCFNLQKTFPCKNTDGWLVAFHKDIKLFDLDVLIRTAVLRKTFIQA